MSDSTHTLLICTLGGTPEPVVASLKRWQPARIRFVVTPETAARVESAVVPLAEAEGVPLDPGRYDLLQLADGQDLTSCVDALRSLTPQVEQWLARGEAFDVVVDVTGGTKCMSAALALQAHRWPCRFSYIGGRERTKDGVGVVVSGTEQIVHAQNPWDALGYRAVEEFVPLFDQRAFPAASRLAGLAMRNVTDSARKRELNALQLLADAFAAWECFDHAGAAKVLQQLSKYGNDLGAMFGAAKAGVLQGQLQQHLAYLQQLMAASPPSHLHVLDLLANARRRGEEGRYDDAVARLYRAIEARAQVQLARDHGIASTASVPLESVPEPLRSEWASKADEEGTLKLGLQDDYALLQALGDDLGRLFVELGLADRQKSPLVARNQSILAHGFTRVGEAVYGKLWQAACRLVDVEESELPVFPRLGA